MLGVVFVPAVKAIFMSFQNYDLRRPSEIGFIGLQNYREIFGDQVFWLSLFKTVLWVIFGVGFQFIFGFLLALLLNRKFKGRGIVRAISLIPWVTPGVLIGLMWKWIYDGNYGVLNDILLKLGLIHDKIPFLAQSSSAFPSVIVTIVWQGIPFFALMLLAGLQGVPGELYEAADIDGATKRQQLFKVTIPSIKNTIFVTTLLRIIWVANSVDVIYNMTGGGPAYATQTLSVYIFNDATALNLGYSSAMSILLTLLLLLVAVPYLRSMFRSQEA
jgi:multiple sugar transport system permease protein